MFQRMLCQKSRVCGELGIKVTIINIFLTSKRGFRPLVSKSQSHIADVIDDGIGSREAGHCLVKLLGALAYTFEHLFRNEFVKHVPFQIDPFRFLQII